MKSQVKPVLVAGILIKSPNLGSQMSLTSMGRAWSKAVLVRHHTKFSVNDFLVPGVAGKSYVSHKGYAFHLHGWPSPDRPYTLDNVYFLLMGKRPEWLGGSWLLWDTPGMGKANLHRTFGTDRSMNST